MKNTTMELQKLDANMKQKLGELLKEYGLIIAGYPLLLALQMTK